MTSSRPPAGLEFKGAAPALAPRLGAPAPEVGTVAPEGIVEMIAAVTGIRDDVADIIVPGAFARTLRERRPKVCQGHQWDRPIGRLLDVKELLPGDPRLPTRTGDGRPWPAEAGALVCTAQMHMDSKAGREAFEIIRFFGTAESQFSIGYKVTDGGARRRGGIRYITDLDLYEVSPVLHGANSYAGLIGVKDAAGPRLERKATSGATADVRRSATVRPCSVCGRPAAAVVPADVRGDLICARCVQDAGDVTAEVGTGTAVLSAEDLAEVDLLDVPELTAEEEFTRALAAEIAYDLETDGTVTLAVPGSPARTGRSWTRQAPTSGWGRP